MNKKRIFFVGINGIGMSALALYLKKKNYWVAGVDKNINSEITHILKNKNIPISSQDSTDPSILIHYDLLVLTNTVSHDNPFYIFAKKNNIAILLRSQFLALLLQNKKIIAITGSHGKTTTTSIVSDLWIKTNSLQPTVFVGGIMKEYNSNFIYNKKPVCIVEADDAYKSFLDLQPNHTIITSISLEHTETYTDIDDIINTFVSFALKTSSNGYIIINNDSENLSRAITLLKNAGRKIITYGLNNNSEYQIKINDNKSFSIYRLNHCIGKYKTPLLGKANIQNCTAAILLLSALKTPHYKIKNALKSFTGVCRRFEYIGKYQNTIPIYDDYGHHPNEIEMVFRIVEAKAEKVIIFFQPHKYVRTKSLWSEFISVFQRNAFLIHMIYITDVYAIEELYDEKFNSKNLVQEIQVHCPQTKYIPYSDAFVSFKDEMNQYTNIREKTSILTLGAGLMNKWGQMLLTL